MNFGPVWPLGIMVDAPRGLACSFEAQRAAASRGTAIAGFILGFSG
ncbi:MAG: hypothetical protein K6U11_14605 [bacterium]|nr:hypothetical protein [bacterium]